MAYDMDKVMEIYHKRLDIQNMRRIFSYGRPAASEMENWWVNTYLFTPEMQEKGMYKDGFEYGRQKTAGITGEGNLIIEVGEGSRTLFSSHTDTVHRTGVKQNVFIDPETMKFTTDSGQCLGGDDGTGIWLMLELIKAEVPGLYIFHRAEEVGGQGSSWIVNNTPELLQGYDRAVAFDRKDDWSIITCQGGVRTCSDPFAYDLAAKLGMNHKPDTTGSFTDTANYDDIIPECTNLSVGYHNAHSARENQEIEYVIKFRDALIKVDWESLVTDRDPQNKQYDYGGYYGYGGLVKPKKSVREEGGWDDWDDYAFEKRKAKEGEDKLREEEMEGKGVIIIEEGGYEDWDRDSAYDRLEEEYSYLWQMRISDMSDEELEIYEILQQGSAGVGFFDDQENYLSWLDDEVDGKYPDDDKGMDEEDDWTDQDIPDDAYDWDSWFIGFN